MLGLVGWWAGGWSERSRSAMARSTSSREHASSDALFGCPSLVLVGGGPCTSATSSTPGRAGSGGGVSQASSGAGQGQNTADPRHPSHLPVKKPESLSQKESSISVARSTRTDNANTRAAGAGGPRPGARRTRTEGLPDRSRPPSAEVRPRRRRRWPLRPSMEEGQYRERQFRRERATLRRHR